jgi:hypothetical protein
MRVGATDVIMPDGHDGFFARQPAGVDSAFAVLEAVAALGAGVTTRELVQALPMSRATVYRIIKHLVAQEYLVRTPNLRGFALGARVAALATAAQLGHVEERAGGVSFETM